MIAQDKLAELVTAVVVLGGIILRVVGEVQSRKAEEESEEELKVVTRQEFDTLKESMENAKDQQKAARSNFDDALACMALVNIIVTVISQDKELLRQAENQVYAFLRHANFPNREMVTTAFELAVTDQKRGASQEKIDIKQIKEVEKWRGGDEEE